MSDKKVIGKNTLALYARMFVSMIVGLYSSRVVLNVLGVEDYGIYGVVGGVVAMMGFLNASMAGTTSRFISFELGRGDEQRLKDTFSSAMIAHLIIASIIFILCETIGLWFVNYKLDIPDNRMVAANFVFQFSILCTFISIVQVPFTACIIAHEKMGIYAYVEILYSVFKLLIVFLLQVLLFDKLIMYAALVSAVAFAVFLIYNIYCKNHFKECTYKLVWNPEVLKPIFSFSGWDLFGNFAGTARQQGVNILLNLFWGPLLNAASSIATSVSGIVSQFAGNVVMALKPQIIKNYANENRSESVRLIRFGCDINFFLMSAIAIPLISEMHYVLELWLKIVPDYSVVFCQISLMTSIVANQSMVVISGIHATGRIKFVSIILGTIYLLVIPITYISFNIGNAMPWLPYVVNLTAAFAGLAVDSIILGKYVQEFSACSYLGTMVLKYVIPFSVILVAVLFLKHIQEEGFVRLLYSVLLSTLLITVYFYYALLTPSSRNVIIHEIKKRIHRDK